MFSRGRFFQKFVILMFCCYLLTMVVVIFVAYLRPSGVVGIDPAQIVQIRYHDNQEKIKRGSCKTQEIF